ncbi:MAG: hypothetical protein ABSC25_22395 [Roseiarcus sp.]
MRIAIVLGVSLFLASCAYNTETVPTAANDTVISYAAKVPGKWIVYVDASALNQVVHPSDFRCTAHTYPLDFTVGLPASVRETMTNIVAQTQDSDTPVAGDLAMHQGARGVISIRGESVEALLRVVPGFWSASIATDVTVTAAVTIDGKGGRLFGKTLEGHGHGDTPAGLFCSGGADSLQQAADKAQHDLVRRIGEEIGNTDRIRG